VVTEKQFPLNQRRIKLSSLYLKFILIASNFILDKRFGWLFNTRK